MSEKKTILLVEPVERMRNMIKRDWITKRPSLLVVETETCADAQRLLQETSVDAIVTDNFRPELAGCELIRWIRQQQDLAHLPIVAIPAMSNIVEDALPITRPLHEAGADSVIYKFFYNEVLSTLKRWRWQRPERQEPGWALDHL
jgi:CheY-like chemotaxis protein